MLFFNLNKHNKQMKRKHLTWLFLVYLLGIFGQTNAQSVLIDPSNSSSIVNAQSTTKGFLPPRMSEIQRNNMTGLVVGVIVYCLDCTLGAGPYSYNGSSWTPMFVTSFSPVIIGQSKFGGVVFYVDESGQHGLVAALSDQSSATWYNGNYKNTLAIRSGIYSGFNNTERINTEQGAGTYAASIATQNNSGGFGDWYLPSKDEMTKMFQQIAVIPAITAGANYWSSTEESVSNAESTSLNAYQVILSSGVSSLQTKSNSARVRAIRRF